MFSLNKLQEKNFSVFTEMDFDSFQISTWCENTLTDRGHVERPIIHVTTSLHIDKPFPGLVMFAAGFNPTRENKFNSTHT